jgi:uncharacterized protein YndB with AHSA1/START domain
MTKKTITLERTFAAPIEDVWELWTTKAGMESWWGPEGFSVEVLELDLRPGGALRYVMTATAPAQVAFMKQAGMPLSSETHGRYDEIVVHRRLAFTQVADFVPGVAPYDIAALIELAPSAHGVRLVVTVDAMHDERWTTMAKLGWESQLGRLTLALAARRAPG